YTACGGDDSTNPVDAGKDTSVADTSVADTSRPDTSVADSSCYDADLSQLLNQDAAGVDAGAFGPCGACLQKNCTSAISTCNMSCTCKDDVVNLITCVGAGGSPTTCGGSLFGDIGDPGVAALVGCVTGPCSICLNPGDG